MEKELLEKAVNEGLKLREIVEKFNSTRGSIAYWLKKYELKCKRDPWTKEKRKRKYHEWYAANFNKTKIYRDRARKKITDFIKSYKLNNPCKKCGETHVACIDLHHVDPSKKEYDIGNIARSTTIERIKKEIQKCISLCSNCHRKFHYEERLNGSLIQSWLSSTRDLVN